MSRTSTIILWIAVILMLGVYFLPLWSISLSAPQYPEGMGMYIWISKLSGHGPHDLQKINGLNHYIGMKEIHAASIPELRFMKFIVAALIVLGALAALLRKRRFLVVFVIVAALVAIVGLVDFYRWSYDYGHNLDPDAPIKVPGMTYQPPLFGSKVLLNITATSLPGVGGWMLIAAVIIATVILLWEGRRTRRLVTQHKGEQMRKAVPVAATVLIAVLAGCSVEPKPIAYGVDNCSYCRMTISDQKYGAELLTRQGRVYKYDAVECLVNDLQRGERRDADARQLLTVDFNRPAQLIDATDAVFLHSNALRSPMAINLTSFADRDAAHDAQRRFKGEVLTWREVLELVRTSQDQVSSW